MKKIRISLLVCLITIWSTFTFCSKSAEEAKRPMISVAIDGSYMEIPEKNVGSDDIVKVDIDIVALAGIKKIYLTDSREVLMNVNGVSYPLESNFDTPTSHKIKGLTLSALDETKEGKVEIIAKVVDLKEQVKSVTIKIAFGAVGNKVSVKDFGAKGDGKTNDTKAIQDAIDYVSDVGGGVVLVPEGTYMIKADVENTKGKDYLRDEGGIAVKDNVHIMLADEATINAFPSSKGQYTIFRVIGKKNVIIEGGTIKGERNLHNGSTGEWGYGIAVQGGRNIIIKDITIKDCWGDGVNIQVNDLLSVNDEGYLPKDIFIENIKALNNRRQGMSIEGGINIRVSDSEFSYTNGIAPSCGIDIEPWGQQNFAKEILIENCIFKENQSSGILVMGNMIDGVTVVNCQFRDNQDSEAQFKTWAYPKNVKVHKCFFEYENTVGSNRGILFQNGETLIATENILTNNIISIRTQEDGSGLLTKDVLIRDNKMTGNIPLWVLFSANKINDLTIDGNIFDVNDSGAVGEEWFTLENCTNLIFTNNTLLAGKRGVGLSNSPGSLFTNNTIHGSALEAGCLENSPNVSLIGNVISGAANQNEGAASFRILTGSDNVKILNNKIYQASQVELAIPSKTYSPGAFLISSDLNRVQVEDNVVYSVNAQTKFDLIIQR